MSEDLRKIDRDNLIHLIGRQITRAVALANHVKRNAQPFKSYVAEKLSTYPVLDAANGEVFERIAVLLESHYGVDIRPSWLKHD